METNIYQIKTMSKKILQTIKAWITIKSHKQM